MSKLLSYSKSINYRKIKPHLVIFGAFLTAKFIFNRLCAISHNICRSQVDIVNRYGKGSFALITGGANGIGKAFAIDLAKKGFNLIILDFNQKALEEVKVEIAEMNNEIIVKTIQIDFSKGDNVEFYEEIRQQIATFDISILINNVGTGVGSFGHFHRLPLKTMIYGFNVNMVPPFMMTSILINQMLLRNNYKSLILNLSSASAYDSLPYFFQYGAAKKAIDTFMDTLNLEFKDRKIKNVDVLTIKPYYVSTALINFKKGFFIIEPEELVKSTWTYIGKENSVTPNWRHNLQLWFEKDILWEWLQTLLVKQTHRVGADQSTLKQGG